MNRADTVRSPGSAPWLASPVQVWAELKYRQPALAWFGLVMLAGMALALLAMGLDDRTLRGVNVWVKPFKFMASVTMFSWWSAWFIGMLNARQQRGAAIRRTVGLIIGAGGFEIGYIVLQAALGQASHYNRSDPLHIALYSLMGAGALALTASQLVIAWQMHRHAAVTITPAMKLAVVLGCVLTFVLGAGAGATMGGVQPPAGIGLPVVGWHLAGGDLRPAHFIGMHAQQLLPLAAWLMSGWRHEKSRLALWTLAAFWTGLWALAYGRGLNLF